MIKTSNFSLIEKNNYNKSFKKELYFYIKEYIILMNEFISYFDKYVEYNNFKKYHVIFKGIQSITHIFLLLLLYTKNLSLTLYHCKKSFLYYVEFINQIGDEGNSYLQLNTKDAILFIYKKSIFEINNEVRENMENSPKDEEMMDDIKKFTNIFKKTYFYLIFNIVISKNESKNVLVLNFIKLLENISKRRSVDECLFDKLVILIEFLTFNKVDNIKYMDIIKVLCKKKKFNLMSKNEFQQMLQKKEAIRSLNYDSYKKIVSYITK
tara:strand:- start:3385 stop:4182 length:798 start_codon:yes stop_codon:yes gene_type:complete